MTTAKVPPPPALLEKICERIGLPAGSLHVADNQPGVNAGLQNANFVLVVKQSDDEEEEAHMLLLRQYPSTALQRNEAWVLRLLERVRPGLAPRCLWEESSPSPVLVEEFVANDGALAPTEITDAVLQEVAKILADLHSTPIHEEVCCSSEDSAPVFLGDDEERAAFANDALWTRLHEKTSPFMAVFASIPRNALVHGDAHCGNVLKTRKGDALRLIDFEAAHVGSPLEDLGCFATVTFPRLPNDRLELFVAAYLVALPQDAARRLLPSDSSAMWTALRLFKLRKLVRMIAFFNKAVANAADKTTPAIVALKGGIAFFTASLEAELEQL